MKKILELNVTEIFLNLIRGVKFLTVKYVSLIGYFPCCRLVRAPVSQLVAARAAHAKQLPEVKLPETNADAGKLSILVQTPDILSMGRSKYEH
jgi:hypothetical protein